MKPKISTGYLTPQAKRKKNVANNRLSDTEENPEPEPVLDKTILAALMKCPEKKKMILDLLASNKDAIENYKKNEAKNNLLTKVKNKKKACESPTALLRRRALEQMNTSPSTTNRSSSSRSESSDHTSRCSTLFSDQSESPLPFDKILLGVVAYVEIRNSHDKDRSSGAKAVLKSMGATVKEKFTNDVTHVIFKDGLFTTYQKAKLMKIHLVSILWVEFCRKTMKRQPERQYPALKSGFQDNETSVICSQMQKEYEDIIRDEYKRSIKDGTPLPSTRSFIDRRRTLMTPSVSNLNSTSTSFQTASEGISFEETSDREVTAINGLNSKSEVVYEKNLILNDPDYFSEVSGPIVDGNYVEKRKKRNSISKCILKSLENIDDPVLKFNNDYISSQKPKSRNDSDMDLTMILNSKTPKAQPSKNDIYDEGTPKLPSQKIPTNLFDRRKTICNSFLSSTTSTTNPISSDNSKTVSSLFSSDKSTNISNNVSFAIPKSMRSSSRLCDSNESLVFGKNKAKCSKISRLELDETEPALSEINLLSNGASKTSSAMSSLQISSEGKVGEKFSEKSLTRRSSSMSNLWLPSKQNSNEKPKISTCVSNLHLSFETSNKKKESWTGERPSETKGKKADKSSISSLQISTKENKKSTDKSFMSTVQISTEDNKKSAGKSSILSGQNSNEENKNSADKSSMSTLQISTENNKKSAGESSILSLQISNEENKNSADKSSMSTLQISTEDNKKSAGKSSILSHQIFNEENKNSADKSSMSTLQISTEDNKKSTGKSSILSQQISKEENKNSANKSSMSTLQISTESKRSLISSTRKINKNVLNSHQSLMSTLNVSSEKSPKSSLIYSKEKSRTNTSFSSRDDSNSVGLNNLVETVINKLQTPESRKNSDTTFLSNASITSDDSEIISPRKALRKTIIRQSIGKRNTSGDHSSSSDDNLSKKRELELCSSITKRRRMLLRESSADMNKELVVRVIKSPLISLQNEKGSAEGSKSVLLNRKRRTLGNKMKSLDVSEMPRKSFHNQNEISIRQNIASNDVFPKNTNKTQKQTETSNSLTSESDMDQSLNGKTKSDDSSDSTKSRIKRRRLYNPDDTIHVLIDDEQEREDKRVEVRRRKSEVGVFLNPAEVLELCENRPKKTSLSECSESESSNESQTRPKRIKKGIKKFVKPLSLNSSVDEQKELLNEFVNKKNNSEVIPKTPIAPAKNNLNDKGKTPKSPKSAVQTPSRRKSTRISKPTPKFIESQKSTTKKIDVLTTPRNRRSTLDFQPVSSSKKPKKVDKVKLPTIVCTKLHKSDVQMFTQIIKKLGRFIVEDEVSSRTTHLVAGEPKRTINMLRAISRGCWILKFEWVLQSLEAGKWLREEDFEVHDFSPAVRKCRLERQAFGTTYTLDVFENCPPIYVALSTNPRCSDLKELITTCRGKVVTVPRMAKIIVGEYLNQEDTMCVNETWVLDCITFKKRIGFKKQYILENIRASKRKSVIV